MIMDFMEWVLVATALYGCFLTTEDDKFCSFYLLVASVGFFFISFNDMELSKSAMFAIFTYLSAKGLLKIELRK